MLKEFLETIKPRVRRAFYGYTPRIAKGLREFGIKKSHTALAKMVLKRDTTYRTCIEHSLAIAEATAQVNRSRGQMIANIFSDYLLIRQNGTLFPANLDKRFWQIDSLWREMTRSYLMREWQAFLILLERIRAELQVFELQFIEQRAG